MGLLACMAQAPVDTVGGDDEYTRANPELEGSMETSSYLSTNYSPYPFLNLKANKIEMNGADWNKLREAFGMANERAVSIVHIGDSHIQCEGAPMRTRAWLQRRFGYAGRGLIIPFRLVGTNNPLDYSITSTTKFKTAKMIKHPWVLPMGFTGVTLEPETSKFDFTITMLESEGYKSDFDVIKVFKEGATPHLQSVINSAGMPLLYNDFVMGDTLVIYLFQPVSSVTLNFYSSDKCQIHGFAVDNEMNGVSYSAIGNNGATYSSYNAVGTVGNDIAALSPSLIIVSLGTNEAFGRIDLDDFYSQVDTMISDLSFYNPEAQVLLITPAECQRSRTTRVGKGKKARKVKTYSVNTNVKRMRDVILQYGKDHNIATYDFYDVAGGDGSSDKWLLPQLMNTDRIHLTWKGYALQGDLLFDALNSEL